MRPWPPALRALRANKLGMRVLGPGKGQERQPRLCHLSTTARAPTRIGTGEDRER